MDLNQAELIALSEPSLPHAAFVLYIKCFRRFMSFKDGTVYTSVSRMIHELDYQPVAKSTDKPVTVTRDKVRNLIKHLIRVGLIQKMKSGNLKAGLSATWVCVLAKTDIKKALICLENEHPKSAHHEHPHEHPSENLVNKGVEADEHPSEHPEQKTDEHHITVVTVIYTYKGLDLKPFKDQVSIEHLKHLIDHRIAKKSKPTQHALSLQVKRLARSQEVGMTPEELIDYTIEKNWVAVNIEYTKNDLGKAHATNQQKTAYISSGTTYTNKSKVDEFFSNPDAQLAALQQASRKQR